MQVDKKLLVELRQIIKDEYGKDLDMATVSEIGNDLVSYFDLLGKNYHKMKEDDETNNEINE